MKLLFDQNLSPSLAHLLGDYFPESTHVSDIGLDTASDALLWEYARKHDYCIVSKDSDFTDWSLLYGHPPGFVWIRLGNCSTSSIATRLIEKREDVMRIGTIDHPWVLIII